ncbi:MAG: hypothetical protein V3V29_09545 [Acidimicrobiia bacterium]
MQPLAYAVFHLNLAFSSIGVEARPDVISRCYRPLLRLAESAEIPIGVELSGWTLEQIQDIDPGWVDAFRALLGAGRCELIGSGYTQLIGPLVPDRVNRWNQRFGLESYDKTLGLRPRIALVNEMAFSASMVDLYASAGYEGFIMDRDNVRLALGIEDHPVTEVPTHGVGPGGAVLPVLWADSILFQKLQHLAHGDIREADYLDHLRRRVAAGETLLPLYANDAEVFDFRPGRFGAESPLHPDGEWDRLQRVFEIVADEVGLAWSSPSDALARIEHGGDQIASPLVSASHPIPVKKQAKYNIGRWAVTGRNDTWINSICHRLAERLDGTDDDGARRALCELWGTDLRTHITPERWEEARDHLADLAARLGVATDYGSLAPVTGSTAETNDGFSLSRDEENILLSLETESVRLVVNLRRGLTVRSLAFGSHGFVPVAGTLPHGYFGTITLGADFYTGGVVVELQKEHRRITDLERVEPAIESVDGGLRLRTEIPTPLGPIVKAITVPRAGEEIRLDYEFPGWERPMGTIRAGTITLLPEAFTAPLDVAVANGGERMEHFVLDRAADHAASSSSLISSTAGLGATDGEIVLGDGSRILTVSWVPGVTAVLPMLVHRPATPHALTRLYFSLQELDDTARPGGPVGALGLTVRSSP